MVETEKYIRKPLYVEAVRVTEDNFDELVAWCQGEVLSEEMGGKLKKYIKVRVHHPTKNPRQTKAFVGDWLLYTEFGGYKVYTNKAFRTTFDLVGEIKGELTDIARHEAEKYGATAEGFEQAQVGNEVHTVEDAQIESYDPEEPSPEGVQPIEATGTDPEFEGVTPTTPEGEPHEYVEATPQAIADAVSGQQPISSDPVSEQPETTGKRVLTEEEQTQMGPDAVRELVQSGEAVLAQDLAA